MENVACQKKVFDFKFKRYLPQKQVISVELRLLLFELSLCIFLFSKNLDCLSLSLRLDQLD